MVGGVVGALLTGLRWLAVGVVSLLVAGFAFALIRFGPVPLTLAWAKDVPDGPEAEPALSLPLDREAVRATLAREIYGDWPDGSVEVVGRTSVPFMGGTLTTLDLRARTASATGTFGVSAVTRDPSAPLVVWSSFSPRGAAIPHESVPGEPGGGLVMAAVEGVFGRYIQTPPLGDILDAGFGFAVLHPPELVPDSADAGERRLRALFAPQNVEGSAGGDTRTGAVAAWAWAGKLALDALEGEGLARGPVVAAGHSRYAKSALVWAAWDARVDGVVAHQSGTGGASLSRSKRGETVEDITGSYPHWFSPGFREEALTLDQHHLLALVAPRPVLLGNARRDVWSDPNGALRAARGAAPAWGVEPPERLDAFDPASPLSLWIRPGTHGIVEEDWPAFLAWLDAHFGGAG